MCVQVWCCGGSSFLWCYTVSLLTLLLHTCFPLVPSTILKPPQVITREVDGAKCEPYEEAVVEVPENYVGSVVELFAQRKGEMVDMQPSVEVSLETLPAMGG